MTTQTKYSLFDTSLSDNSNIIGVGNVSTIVSRMIEAFRPLVQNTPMNWKIIPADRESDRFRGLHYSAVIMLGGFQTEGAPWVYVTVLIADSNDDPAPLIGGRGDQQYEVVRYPSDAIDTAMYQIVEEGLSATFPGKTLIRGKSLVMQKGFNISDAEALRVLLVEMSRAIQRQCNELLGSAIPLDLTTFDMSSAVFNVKTTTQEQGHIDPITCLPIHRTWSVKSTMVAANQGQQGRHEINNARLQPRTVADIGGYCDYIWVGPQQIQAFGGGVQLAPGTMNTQAFQLRHMITSISLGLRQSIEGLLFGIGLAAPALNDRLNIAGMTTTRRDQLSPVNLGNIGALNIEANIENDPSGQGSCIDATSASFGLAQHADFIGRTIHQTPVITVEIRRGCPEETSLHMLLEASRGNPEAVANLHRAADLLTGGHYSKRLKEVTNGATVPMVIQVGDQNNGALDVDDVGFFVDQANRMRSLQELGYLGLMNLLQGTPGIGRRITDTFQSLMDARLAERLNIRHALRTQALPGNQIYRHSRVIRVTLNNVALRALTLALGDAGVAVNASSDSPYSSMSSFSQRAVPVFAQMQAAGISPYAQSSSNFGQMNFFRV